MGTACSTYVGEVHTGGNLREGGHLENPGVAGEDNIKMNLREVGREHGVDRSGTGYGRVVGFYEFGNEPSGFVKRGEFID
jgi:hypothetical protein